MTRSYHHFLSLLCLCFLMGTLQGMGQPRQEPPTKEEKEQAMAILSYYTAATAIGFFPGLFFKTQGSANRFFFPLAFSGALAFLFNRMHEKICKGINNRRNILSRVTETAVNHYCDVGIYAGLTATSFLSGGAFAAMVRGVFGY